jgi:hypothetical protein
VTAFAEEFYDPANLDKTGLGLIPVTQLDTYRGPRAAATAARHHVLGRHGVSQPVLPARDDPRIGRRGTGAVPGIQTLGTTSLTTTRVHSFFVIDKCAPAELITASKQTYIHTFG